MKQASTSNDKPYKISNKRKSERFFDLLAYCILGAGALFILTPFAWMISTSLKTKADVLVFPPKWIPYPVEWHNYVDTFTTFPFLHYTWNSIVIVFFVLIGTLLSCSFSTYGFSRLRAPGRDVIFLVLLSTMMLPQAVTLVPMYIFYNKIGWVNTYLPLIVPAFFGNAFFIFLMRQFYMGVPRELEDAARIDGCNSFGIWWRIMLPLSKPVLATIAVFSFMGTWNDFMSPLIYITDANKRTLALALSYFEGSARSAPDLNLLMCATLFAITPCVVLFFLAQKIFVKGIVFKGLK